MCFCPSSSILFRGECRDSPSFSLTLSRSLSLSEGIWADPEYGAPLRAQLSVCNEPWWNITDWNVIIHAGLDEEHVASGRLGPRRPPPRLPEQCRGTASTARPAVVQWSCCAVLSPLPRFYSESLKVGGCLWSLACQCISLGNKANCLLWIPSFFTPHLWLYMFGFLPGFWPAAEFVEEA